VAAVNAYDYSAVINAISNLVIISTEDPTLAPAKTAKKAEIDALITGLNPSDYTSDSWAAVTTAVTAAKAAVDALTAVAAVNAYDYSAVINAISGLKTTDTALADAKTAAAALTQADYTATSWSALTTALALPESDNAEKAAKTTAIDNAITALVFAGAADLATAKTAAAALTQADYTASTWAALTTALALPETTNVEITAKTTAINNAIMGLVSAADQDAANAVIALITALNPADGDHSVKVAAARAAYDSISAAQKALVTNYGVLTAAETALEAAALTVAKTTKKADIDALIYGKIESDYSAASWAAATGAIATAKSAVDALTTLPAVNAYDLTTVTAAVNGLVLKTTADDELVKAKQSDTAFLNATYATKEAAESAIKALAANGTLTAASISWNEAAMTATVSLNSGTATFVFTKITELVVAPDVYELVYSGTLSGVNIEDLRISIPAGYLYDSANVNALINGLSYKKNGTPETAAFLVYEAYDPPFLINGPIINIGSAAPSGEKGGTDPAEDADNVAVVVGGLVVAVYSIIFE
jgi:hypothetical protein